jgi:hypothetical protein
MPAATHVSIALPSQHPPPAHLPPEQHAADALPHV